MSRNACNGENGKKRQKAGDSNWMPKVAPWRVAILAKMSNLAQMAKNHLAPCLAQTAKNRQRVGNIQNAANIQIGCQIFI